MVVPESLRERVLSTLHSAHQGTTSMRLRAEKNMFWPNMATDIANTRNHCTSCDAQFPSQSAEPPITPAPPEYPFQHICSDYLSVAGHNFCLVVDRFSNWLQVYTGKGGARNLIHLLGESFHSFGIPESLTSDQGVEYTAAETQQFLRKLGIIHRKTSVGFPHANQKAERSVAAAKRVIRDAVGPTGELDTVKLVKGLLQLRNTPDPDTGLSPAEMLLGRQLRDFVPAKPKPHITSSKDFQEVWKSVADWRELALAPRSAKLHDRLSQQTKELPPLEVGDCVLIQNLLGNHPKRWDKRGVVIQADAEHRQYKVMTFGSRRMTIRNRRHLRKFTPVNTPANMPLGLPKNNLLSPAPVMRRQEPPTLVKEYDLPSPPPPQPGEEQPVHIQTTEPVTDQPQYVQTQSLPQHWQVQQQHQEPVQSHPVDQHNTVPDYFHEDARQDIPGIHINQGNSVNTSPYQQDMNIPYQVPEADHSPPLRRSERATRGQTRRYDDFVQNIFPVCSPSQVPSNHYQCQYPQMMTNLMWPNQLMPNQMMTNQLMTNQLMTSHLPQPTMQWYQ